MVRFCEQVGILSPSELDVWVSFFSHKRVAEITEDPISKLVSVSKFSFRVSIIISGCFQITIVVSWVNVIRIRNENRQSPITSLLEISLDSGRIRCQSDYSVCVSNFETFIELEPSPNRIFLASFKLGWVLELDLIGLSIICGENKFFLLDWFLHEGNLLSWHRPEFDHCCFDQVFSSLNETTSTQNNSQIEYSTLEGKVTELLLSYDSSQIISEKEVFNIIHFNSPDLLKVSEVHITHCSGIFFESFVSEVDEVPVSFQLIIVVDVSVHIRHFPHSIVSRKVICSMSNEGWEHSISWLGVVLISFGRG